MDVWTAIATRRVIREFTDRRLAEGDLRRILDAGRRAGSSKNLQRWDFVVIEDRARLTELTGVGPFARHLGGAAAAVALITPNPHAPGSPLSVVWDLGGAATQMMLAAWELGIGSCPATVYDHALAQRLLGYPPDRFCEYLISFGYPADPGLLSAPNRPGGRRPLDDIVHHERW